MGRVVRYYGDDVGVNIFITTTLVALVRQVRREISSSPPPLPIVFPFPRALASRGDVEIARLIYDYFGLAELFISFLLFFSLFFSFTLNSFTLKHVQAWFEGYAFFPDQI